MSEKTIHLPSYTNLDEEAKGDPVSDRLVTMAKECASRDCIPFAEAAKKLARESTEFQTLLTRR